MSYRMIVDVDYLKKDISHTLSFFDKKEFDSKEDLLFFDLKENAASYIITDDEGVNNPPKVSDLLLEPNSFYKLEVHSDLVLGSVIFYYLAFGKSGKIGDQSQVLRSNDSILIPIETGQGYSSSRVGFRVAGSGQFKVKNIIVEKLSKSAYQDFIEECFLHSREVANKSLVDIYYGILRRLDTANMSLLTLKSYLQYLNENNLFPEVSIIANNLGDNRVALESDPVICEIFEKAAMVNIEEECKKLALKLSQLGVKYYRVKLINSGFGDLLSVANMVAYFCELLGLEYAGLDHTVGIKNRHYYQELLHFFSMKQSSEINKVLRLEIFDIKKDLGKLHSQLEDIVFGDFDTLTLNLANPSSLSQLRYNLGFCSNWLNNSFSKSFYKNISEHKFEEVRQSEKLVVTIHVRLGDVAAIPLDGRAVVPYEVARGNLSSGVVSLSQLDNGGVAASAYLLLDQLQFAVSELRKRNPDIIIYVVSDGFERAVERLCDSKVIDSLGLYGVEYSEKDVELAVENLNGKLHSLDCDNAVIGDSAKNFIETVRIILNSNVIVSTSRSFVFNILAHFKTNYSVKHLFFSPVVGSYFDALISKNVEMVRFRDFDSSVEALNKMVAKAAMDINSFDMKENDKFKDDVNIAIFSSYSTSSVSHWEKFRSGSPNDGYKKEDRYSFHTEEEDFPFLLLDFDRQVRVCGINVVLRGEYSEKILPISVYISADGEDWVQVACVERMRISTGIVIPENLSSLQYIKIQKDGYGFLYLSSVNVYAKKEFFLEDFARGKGAESKYLTLAHSPFYGLGGRLSVLATALGYVHTLDNKNLLVKWEGDSASRLLAYPPEIDYYGEHESLIRRNLSKAIASSIFSDEKLLRSSRAISHWLPPDQDGQDRKVVFISRNNLEKFINRHESKFSCMKRLYKNIVPSEAVNDYIFQLERELNLFDLYPRALGVHVRHGNGERYFNASNGDWGVKPPAGNKIILGIEKLLKQSGSDINTIIISSDCRAVEHLIVKNLGDAYKIVFVSKNIQTLGAGCNHLPNVFDKEVERFSVDLEYDELVTLSEILILSKCASLCGGKSFFFDAVIGFSDCDDDNISWIDNSDRYVKVDPACIPLGDVFQNNVADFIVSTLRDNDILIDGLFMDETLEDELIGLYFFNDLVFSGELDEFAREVVSGAFKRKMLELRLY